VIIKHKGIIFLLLFFILYRPSLGQDTGSVFITSQPIGASVYINGRHIGHTPLPINDLSKGQHTLILDMENYKEVAKTITVTSKSKLTVNIILQRKDNCRNQIKNRGKLIYICIIFFIIFLPLSITLLSRKYGICKKIKLPLINGDYNITGKSSEDSFYTIYRGKHKFKEQEVSIKIPVLADPLFIKLFHKNTELWKGLSHPNIISVYDYRTDEKPQYLVSEYIEAFTLEDIIIENIDITQIVDIIFQISLAIGYSQVKNVIHGDIRPSNILITESGQVKLNNFCIYDLYNYTVSNKGIYKEDIHYMSPEKLETKKQDIKSDLFSIGIIFYKLLTGKLPFEGDNPNKLLESYNYKKPLSVRNINAELSEEIDELVANLIEINPAKRLKSIEMLMMKLKGIKDSLE
jgi:hypothetical protein